MPEIRAAKSTAGTDRNPELSDSTIAAAAVSKVPGSLLFWILKIAATTPGETAGDAVSMSLGSSAISVGTAIFATAFAVAVAVQIRVGNSSRSFYWFTIIATTTVGTTLADFADCSLGIGYAGGSFAAARPLGSHRWIVWHRTCSARSPSSMRQQRRAPRCFTGSRSCSRRRFLGTALGDWTADSAGFGYTGAMLIFGGLLARAGGALFLDPHFALRCFSGLAFVSDASARRGGRRFSRLAGGKAGGLALSRFRRIGLRCSH